MTVRLTPEAEADLGEVFAWYSERGTTLGLELLVSFTDGLRRIEALPQSAPEVHQGIRRVLLNRFPYCVFYLLRMGLSSSAASTRAEIPAYGSCEQASNKALQLTARRLGRSGGPAWPSAGQSRVVTRPAAGRGIVGERAGGS